MIKIGDKLPDITLRSVADDGTQNFNFYDKFKDKNVLIICVPGAFTSTCHINHLPPFINGARDLMSKKKIDLICCITTNDPYVLNLWRESLGESEITFLSDGNLEFLNTSQLIRDHKKNFMGYRLIRSVILIKNLLITNIICDDPGELDKTRFESVLKTI